MSYFDFLFSYYNMIFSKFSYLMYLEQVNSVESSAYAGGTECQSKLPTQTSKEDPDHKQ